ncbi:disulfide oxidoreductase [candidate division LCP-89 bacterium B3_LCP]|uniref:Disulfide oxidoreductase n=1 Tax=candidate division LCP-89 bacterium B3_LCP TaxID=2012998 RepID=A0A532UVU2_UNCL8|nr:MAG: disulfide oxidoreductase [candidate division LCP-89 bacterium B3_LCP]
MNNSGPITADMTIAEVLQRYPEAEKTLDKYKLHCVGCEVASLETVAVGAATHGVEDLQELLKDLNAAINS